MAISFRLLHHPSSMPSQEGHKSQCLGIGISLTGNQFVSPPGRDSVHILEHFKAPGRMSSLFPSLTSPVSRKLDPLNSSVCALLSLVPPAHSPNDHHAQVTPLPRTLINAGHCHWPGLEEGTRPCMQGQCSSSLDLQSKEHYKC